MILLLVLVLPIPHSEANSNLSVRLGWKEIAVGSIHSLGIKNDGTVWQWGNNTTYGAQGEQKRLVASVPEKVVGLPAIKALAAGQTHSMALGVDGTVWTWGGNDNGQIGNGTETDSLIPQQVKGLSNVISIDADWTKSYAVKDDGTIWVWGGFYYKDANGNVQNPKSPVRLKGFEQIISVSAGYGSFMALKSDGTVWYNYDGLTQVPGITDIVQIAVGAQYVYGLKSNGTVWYWGSGGVGMVNGVVVDDDSAPRAVANMTDVVAIQASAGGPLMLRSDGTVWASGDNPGGQLGIGSYKSSDVPVQVLLLKKITRIAAHGLGYRSMAIRADGTLWSWGKGYTGDGTKWDRTTPVGIPSFNNEVIEKDPIFVEVNGTTLMFEQPPATINNRTMVPLRAIFEAMGADLEWDPATATITAKKNDLTIVLVVGSSIATINGKSVSLEAPPTIKNNFTLVPVRFIGEALGALVDWDPTNKTVIIKSKT